MRTRTLLLLAVGCGLAILLAGGIQVLRLSGQRQSAKLLVVGQTGRAGDVDVELLSSSTSDSQLVAVVRIGGAVDGDGIDGFKLVAPGKVLTVTASTCRGIAVAPAECELSFTTSGLQGTARELIFRRANEQLRWVLARAG